MEDKNTKKSVVNKKEEIAGHIQDIKSAHNRSKMSKHVKKEDEELPKLMIALVAVAVILVLFNQLQLNSVSTMIDEGFGGENGRSISLAGGGKDLSNIDVSSLKSTGHTIAAVFPVENIQTQEDAMAMMFPTGTPEYGEALGVSFDDPIKSLSTLSRMYPSLKSEVEKNNPQAWQRFMSLASKPVGISCEYCCGLQAIGIDRNGNSACGCQHNPALLTTALYLTAYTDYSDAQILQEVMKWKTLFFPKDMIGLGMTVAGGDTSSLQELPGMVGGC